MEEFFDKHKALIITVLLFAVLFLALYNFNLSSKNRETSEMLVNLEQIKELQKEEQEQEEAQETPQQQRQVQTHQAYNENQEGREQNFDRQLNEIFEKNSAARQEASENATESASSGNFNVSKKQKAPQKRSDGNNSTNSTSAKEGSMENSSISFSLVDRNAVQIPNPVYTCDTPGRIVVNITVNAEGMVTETSINKASSTSSNECLIEQALQYAAGARFSPLAGRNSQPGTISYQFKP
ncbi:TonB family protein [Zunongwangia sp. F363]|uniref:TonB family protein n=1 Tax=Autumnicola tepida TaxID=3075595 RepID=A0ABU3C4H9_9FLAO|nr:TonB family protein [Zunongwangia sp. F363]MDT0641221.1 TonB family protein [Zunongwangia sp. F363]